MGDEMQSSSERKTSLLEKLSALMLATDEVIGDLIRIELEEEVHPGLVKALEDATARAGRAIADLDLPQEQIKETEQSILHADMEVRAYQEDLTSEDMDIRVKARVFAEQYQKELDSYTAKLAQQKDYLRALTDEHNAANIAVAEAVRELSLYDLNLQGDNIFTHNGQDCESYSLRMGSFFHYRLLMEKKTMHVEYPAAVRAWENAAMVAELRTDDLVERLRSRAVQESIEHFNQNSPRGNQVPQGADIVASTQVSLERAADNIRASRDVSVPVRNAPQVRDFMKVPGRRG